MPSDDSDKTVFKQLVARPDQTVVMPMPGGRSAAGAQPRNSAQQQHYQGQVVNTRVAPAAETMGNTNSGNLTHGDVAYFNTQYGLNPIVNAASTLLAVYEKTRFSVSHADVNGLRRQLDHEIRAFENSLRDQGIKPEIILSVRYLLCSLLDEAVLNTPWGSESAWAQSTLLSVFHNETSGGEKFFLILDRMREMPGENLAVLELIYICLSLGFEGKYRLVQRGRDQLEQIRDELFTVIRNYRGEYERALSPTWQGLGQVSNTLGQSIPLWVVASIVAAILFFSYSGFRYWLYQSSTPVAQELLEISAQKPDSKT